MKKLIVGLFLLLILAIGGAFLYVENLDWNKHKDKISEQFYNLTGKYITFEGNVSFNVFPTPYLKAVNAKIYNTKDKRENPLLDVKNINAELALIPLLKGKVNISKMELDGVVMNINWDDEGLNWQGDLSADQRQMLENTQAELNNISFRNAKMNFEASEGDVKFSIDGLSGAVSVQSVFGPFRIEGNYLKSSEPQGFAITIGKLEESMATTLNAAFTHPKSNSYVRFDGSFQLKNKVLNGNVIVESQKLSDFVNDNTDKIKLSSEYNKPIVAGFDMAVNSQMINLNNIVVKYEDTQGAGSVQIPNTWFEDPDIKVNFEFADLNLEPLVNYIKEFVAKYSKEPFIEGPKIKISGDVKSIRATYKGQLFKNLVSSFDLNEKGFVVDELSVILPGNTQFVMNGNVYPYEEELYYQADISLETEELLRLLKWFEIEPKVTASSVYKKMLLTANMSGSFEKFQITPFKLILDGSVFNGDAGIILGERKDIMLNMNVNTLNFDNYISSIPEEIKVKNFAERLNYRFAKLGMLNNFDMVLNADANLVIYEGLPFEKIKFKGNILQGKMEVESFKVEKVANTTIDLTGKVSGFGLKPIFENVQYSIATDDVVNMIEKFGLYKPEVDYNKFSNLVADGIFNGEMNDFGISTQFTSGDLTVNYVGRVSLANNVNFDGNIELKHPETKVFIDAIGLDYEPQATNLGMFRVKSDIKGSLDNLSLTSAEINSGYSKFNGDISYDFRGANKIAKANLDVNKLELEKYFVKDNNKLPVGAKTDDGIATFLDKPIWSKELINYTPYLDWDFKGNFKVATLTYKDYVFDKAKFNLDVNKENLNLSNFEATYKNTPIKASVVLNMKVNPNVNMAIDVPQANINDFIIGGRLYNLKEGSFKTSVRLTSKATSEEEFIKNLNGSVDFEIDKTNFFGVNIPAIFEDVVKRNKSEGLTEFANSQINSGSTRFDKIVGKLSVANGDFKIVNGKLVAKNTKVTAVGNGSINDWMMSVLFDIKHDEPTYLQNYTITMKNSMDNPDVEIDVSKLFNIFKTQEENKEAEEKALIEAEKMRIAKLVNEQKKIAEDLVKSTKGKMIAEIEDQIKSAYGEDAIKSYEEIKKELNNLLSTFLEGTLIVDSENATQEQIDNLKKINTKAIQDIELLSNKLEQVYLGDLQKQNSDEYNKLVKENDGLKQIVTNYNAVNATLESRLAAIITPYSLEKDTVYTEGKKQIDEKINELESLNNSVVTARNLLQANATADEYKKLNAEMAGILNKIVQEKNELDVKIKEFERVMIPIIEREEEYYKAKIVEEENQRLIQENIGSISVSKTGKTIMIKRDIEDIKDANEEISNEGVKVLDFSKKKTQKEDETSRGFGGVVKKGRIKR